MGQGLHTKVAQIAASAFHIPLCSMKEVLINLFKVFIPNQDHTKMMTNTEQTATTAHMGVSFKLLSAKNLRVISFLSFFVRPLFS
ncbi:hypothetical protein JHK86_024663 [Glycine max]|nr:hypothetical protein JHK86_024663 [Glycine max]